MRRITGPELLTPWEACAALNIDLAELEAWTNEGVLEYYLNMNGCRRYARAEIEALLNAGYTNGLPSPGQGASTAVKQSERNDSNEG